MPYQIGDLEDFQEADPEFEDNQEAIRQAIERSRYRDCAQGVWTSQAEGSDVVAIAYQGDLFS